MRACVRVCVCMCVRVCVCVCVHVCVCPGQGDASTWALPERPTLLTSAHGVQTTHSDDDDDDDGNVCVCVCVVCMQYARVVCVCARARHKQLTQRGTSQHRTVDNNVGP